MECRRRHHLHHYSGRLAISNLGDPGLGGLRIAHHAGPTKMFTPIGVGEHFYGVVVCSARGPDGADSRDLALIADGIRVADSVGTGNVITAWPRDPIWEDKNINNALTSASGRISFTHTCAHQSPYRRRIEIATTRSQLDSVCLRCRAVTGPCEFTLRPRRTFYDAMAVDAAAGGLWGNIWRSIAGAIVANATRRRELEESARRNSGAVVGRVAAGDAGGVS